MKILISEDNDQKFKSILNVVLSVYPEAEVTRATYSKEGVVLLKNERFNFLIQDMFLPINSDSRIDNKGGIYALNRIRHRNIDVKYCICSSDAISYESMKEAGFQDTPFIDYSSFNFQMDLIKFLKSK